MLRDGLNHVLCRKRRDAIRQRAPEFHRWQSHRRFKRWKAALSGALVRIEPWPDREAGAAMVRDCKRRLTAELRRVGVL